MSTFKDFLIGKEDKFYSLASDLVAESEFELEAVTKCIELARDMNLLCVLGGAESISIVRYRRYSMQYAIIDFATQTTLFFATFEEASNACTSYNVTTSPSQAVVVCLAELEMQLL